MSLKNSIDPNRLPKHIAIIMDGNGRWAKSRGRFRVFGHQNGVKAVRESVESCAELGIACLTLYAFSTENWNRPDYEVKALMKLLAKTIKKELPTLMKNNIRLNAIGDIGSLPQECLQTLNMACEKTAGNTGMDLVLALSYSSRWDLTQAVKKVCSMVTEGVISTLSVTEDMITSALSTSKFPSPDLLIRTSGEHRISNFLLWEIAYSELAFLDVMWPDFNRENLYQTLIEFQKRERRFGKTSEQLIEEGISL